MEHTPVDKVLERFDEDPMRDRKGDDERVGRMVQGPGGEGDEFPDFTDDEVTAPHAQGKEAPLPAKKAPARGPDGA